MTAANKGGRPRGSKNKVSQEKQQAEEERLRAEQEQREREAQRQAEEDKKKRKKPTKFPAEGGSGRLVCAHKHRD